MSSLPGYERGVDGREYAPEPFRDPLLDKGTYREFSSRPVTRETQAEMEKQSAAKIPTSSEMLDALARQRKERGDVAGAAMYQEGARVIRACLALDASHLRDLARRAEGIES